MENRAAKIHILDRISLLPEPILHKILCSLPQKMAIKTCVLSKAWRYLGCTRPKIDFWPPVNVSALVSILQAYHDRNLRLDEFSLFLSNEDSDPAASASLLDKWIPIIVQNMRVKTFHIYLDYTPRLELPSSILESHHIQNLSLNECIFKSSPEVRVDLKHLRILFLSRVYIPEEILDKLLSISCCPLIEDVSILYCWGFTRMKLLSSNPQNLTRFCFGCDHHRDSIEIGNGIQTLKSIKLSNCLLSVSCNKPLLSGSLFSSRNLTRLDLSEVYVPEQILGDVLSNCTSIENVSLVWCKGITRIALLENNKPMNIAYFSFRGLANVDDVSVVEIGNDMQTLRTVELDRCLFSVSRNEPFELARLARLSLREVQVSSGSLSCNLHSLEELSLYQCSGIKELKLSSRSMKRLTINNVGTPFKATIDAPSIVGFNFEGILPQSISFATISSSDDHLWKSEINLGPSSDEPSRCFNELYGLLKALSQSEISLELDQIEIRRFQSQLSIGDDAKHEPPVAVEHLTINRPDTNAHSSAASFLNMLFHMFRPSFIYICKDMLNISNYQRSREIAELLFKERGTASIHESYIWQRVLEGVGLQVRYRRYEWQAVQYTSLCFRLLSNKCAMGDHQLRIHLKWKD